MEATFDLNVCRFQTFTISLFSCEQEVTENSLSMWDTTRPWAPQRLVQDNKTLVSQQVGAHQQIVFFPACFRNSYFIAYTQIWPDTLAVGKGGSEVLTKTGMKVSPRMTISDVTISDVSGVTISDVTISDCQKSNTKLFRSGRQPEAGPLTPSPGWSGLFWRKVNRLLAMQDSCGCSSQ